MTRILVGGGLAFLVLFLVTKLWQPLGQWFFDLGLGSASLGLPIVVIVVLVGATAYFARELL